MFTEDKLVSLAKFSTYSEADAEHEAMCEKYPNAWIEVVSEGEMSIV